LLLAAVSVTALAAAPSQRSALGVLFALTVGLVLFPSLTTEVDDDYVRCYFGFGIIRRRVPLSDIADVSVVRNALRFGWGFRWIPNGWLWNVSGFNAVELQLASGRRFRIGTDEPEKLHATLTRVLEARRRLA
jgi:hypothetical protein